MRFTVSVVVALSLSTWLTVHLSADKPLKPSRYAAVADVESQIKEYLDDLEDDLADADEYEETQRNRVNLNANTVVVLAQVLGTHDQSSDLKAAAPAIIAAAGKVAEKSDDFAAASKALAELKAAMSAKSDEAVKFEAVADLQALMKQVPIVNNSLRRGVSGRRFARSKDRNIGLATTLAAIAHASQIDTGYCAEAADEAKWRAICADFRDACADVSSACRKGDQDAANSALARIVKTCDACHESFR